MNWDEPKAVPPEKDLRTESQRRRDAEAANIRMVDLDDGHFEVFGIANQDHTPAGKVWRLISFPESGSVVVVPYAESGSPVPSLHAPPAEIQSVLFEVKWILWRMANLFRVGLYDVHSLTMAEAKKRTRDWRMQNPLTHLDSWEQDRAAYHEEKDAALFQAGLADEEGKTLSHQPPQELVDKWIAEKADVAKLYWAYQEERIQRWEAISKDLREKYRLEDPARMLGVKEDRAKLRSFEDAAEAEAKPIFQAKAAEEKSEERKAIHEEVADFIKRICELPDASVEQVDKVFAVFFEAREAVKGISVLWPHEKLVELSGKISAILGTDVYSRVASHYPNEEVQGRMASSAHRLVERDGLSPKEALAKVCRDIKYVATFTPKLPGTPVLVRDVIRAGHSLEDNLYWRSVAPFTAEHFGLEARRQSMKDESEFRTKLFADEQKVKVIDPSTAWYVSAADAQSRIGKGAKWWTNHINEIEKISPPWFEPGKKNPKYDPRPIKAWLAKGGGKRSRTVKGNTPPPVQPTNGGPSPAPSP